ALAARGRGDLVVTAGRGSVLGELDAGDVPGVGHVAGHDEAALVGHVGDPAAGVGDEVVPGWGAVAEVTGQGWVGEAVASPGPGLGVISGVGDAGDQADAR